MIYEHKNKVRFINLLLILVLVIIGIFGIDFSLNYLWKNWYWDYAPLHSALEILGSVAAILMSIVLLQKKQEKKSANLFFMILGFLSIGLLKGFHAITTVGHGFRLLSSVSYLVSGFFFTLAWIPHSITDRYASKKKGALWFIIISSIVLGVYTPMFRETLPAMVHNGEITTFAMWINLMAGMFFIIAGWRFLLDFYRSGNLEFYLFVYLTLFWGLSCLLFSHSTYWSAEWWIFNVLGLSTYLLALRFVVNNYLNTVFNLRATFADCKLKDGLLEESEAKYSTLVEQAKDGVFIIQDGVCKFANKAMGEITGYPVNELIDMPLSPIVMSECKDLDTQNPKPSCISGKKVDLACEMKIRSKDGIIKDTEISTTFIQYNRKTATLGIARDITERKKTAQELQKMLKIESIGVLAGGIAHDFNNILVSIVGSLSLLRLHTKSEAKFYEILNRAEKAASRAGDLTRQLLTFSKGGAPIKKITSIPGLIEDTVNFSLKGSKVRCEFFMDNSLWPVEIDDAQISQVINNLIINANQAMPNGGIIKICLKNVTVGTNDNLPLKEGRYIALSIKDRGIGISKKDLHKIFDPYFTTKENGSGLGLAISYSIVKKHGGYMRAESEVGVGTTFDIYLPALEREIFTMKDIEEERIYFGKGRILLMDDQQSVREMVGEMLRDIGYEVEFAKEGGEALELFSKAERSGQAFDAVIVDLTIPGGMGGDEVIRKLQEKNSEVRVIVSSGYSNDPIMSEYKKYGFSGVVAKPYGIIELSKILYKVINGIEESSLNR